MMEKKSYTSEKHYVHKIGWLRAAVLGANDGILSTTSLVIGVAAASTNREFIILSAVSGIIAGAMSMASGEYVSVSSQEDIEKSDLIREQRELDATPEVELQELAKIYQKRGLDKELSIKVAEQLTNHNALAAHARDELGINEISKARPLQAALASLFSFLSGGILPLLLSIFAPLTHMVLMQYLFSIIFLIILGAISAKTGGYSMLKGMFKIAFWGTLSMGLAAFVGHLFGVQVG